MMDLVTALKRVTAGRNDQIIEKHFKNIMSNWDRYKNISDNKIEKPRKPTPDDIVDFKNQYGDLSIIYRCIGISMNKGDTFEDMIDYKNLGIYWSYDKNQAICHWNMGEDYWFILTANLPSKINWIETIIQFLTPDRSEEKEVRLPKGVNINVTDIEVWDDNAKVVKKFKGQKGTT